MDQALASHPAAQNLGVMVISIVEIPMWVL